MRTGWYCIGTLLFAATALAQGTWNYREASGRSATVAAWARDGSILVVMAESQPAKKCDRGTACGEEDVVALRSSDLSVVARWKRLCWWEEPLDVVGTASEGCKEDAALDRFIAQHAIVEAKEAPATVTAAEEGLALRLGGQLLPLGTASDLLVKGKPAACMPRIKWRATGSTSPGSDRIAVAVMATEKLPRGCKVTKMRLLPALSGFRVIPLQREGAASAPAATGTAGGGPVDAGTRERHQRFYQAFVRADEATYGAFWQCLYRDGTQQAFALPNELSLYEKIIKACDANRGSYPSYVEEKCRPSISGFQRNWAELKAPPEYAGPLRRYGENAARLAEIVVRIAKQLAAQGGGSAAARDRQTKILAPLGRAWAEYRDVREDILKTVAQVLN